MTNARWNPAAAQPCLRVLADLDRLSERLTARVRREVPAYMHLGEAEHRWNARDAAEMLLRGLHEGAGPTSAQLRAIGSATHRRLAQGLQVHEVLAAFHICAREVWDELRLNSDDDAALVALAAPLWEWIQAMSSTVADVYSEAAGSFRGQEVVRRQRLVELLCAGSASDERTAVLARELGFESTGRFTALVSPAEQWSQGLLDPLQRELQRSQGIAHCALHARLMIVLVQGETPAAVSATVTTLGGSGTRIGIGLERELLHGAAESIVDAERALALTEAAVPVVAFAEAWLRASLDDAADRLGPLFLSVQRAGSDHPELAATVLAYADSGFSAAATAARLHVHPNTVSYRLNRWHELTGANPRSFEGLARSVVALGG